MFFLNENLFTFNNDGYLTYFKKSSSHSKTNYELVESYSHRIQKLRDNDVQIQITNMTLLNNKLILGSDISKVLVFI